MPFPEVAEVVAPWLERSGATGPSQGLPPHVTLLFPCSRNADAIAAVLDGTLAFDVDFQKARRFPGVVWLAPEPADPFVRLTEALVERFPEWPPYGGGFDEIVPHLTIAEASLLDEAEADVAPRLPVRGRAREAVLLAELEPDRWRPVARFPFREP